MTRPLRDHLINFALVVVLAGIVGCFLSACSGVTDPTIKPCEYVGKPLTDSTVVVWYKVLPCWDTAQWRVVRKR